MEFKEEDYLQLSGLQHFSFCRRQWALIHIEQLWAENLRTVEGDLLHEKVHDPAASGMRKGSFVSRGMPVFSRTLGISGECDAVEFQRAAAGVTLHGREGKYRVYPIEYKRGEPKECDADLLQLTAQAMCLEEMLVCEISEGALFYAKTRRRQVVVFTTELREKVVAAFAEMHRYYREGRIPQAKPSKSCNACSLKELCLPRLVKLTGAAEYNRITLTEEL